MAVNKNNNNYRKKQSNNKLNNSKIDDTVKNNTADDKIKKAKKKKSISIDIKNDLNNIKENNNDNRITEIVNIETKSDLNEKNNDNINIENKNENVSKKVDIKSNNGKNRIFLCFLILFLIAILVYLFIPKIHLQGNKNITISYDQNYIEPGYKASFLFKNISNNIKISNNIVNGRVGKYKVIYFYKLGKIIFKKERIVNIIDNKKPEVLLDDEISICPNDDISSIKYEVFDEYDGDITNKSTSKYLNDKLIISASDSSNNSIVKEIIIKKEDILKPEIKLKGNETIYLNYGSAYYEPGYEVIDNCDGEITNKVNINGKVGEAVGTYKITYSVSDSSNNKSEVIRTVIIKNNNLYNSGSIGNGTIYLTFDDGPSWGTTNVILDVLKEEGVVATFFVTCNGPDSLIKRMYDEGHTVALHTASHNYSYIYSSVDNYFADLNKVSNRVKNITGIESKIIRFPGGSSNTVSRQYKIGIMSELTGMVLDKGYRYFDWNVDSNDAGSARSSSDVYNNVVWNLSKSRSNVVLMHDIKYTTRDAIRNIIKYGKANGYSFNKIDMNTYMVRHGVNN